MKQSLNERQTEIAIAMREVAKTPDGDSWGAFTDCMRSISVMLEGTERLVSPIKMQERFAVTWKIYSVMWAGELNRMIRDCLGSQEEADRIKGHPHGRDIIERILCRIEETFGGLSVGIEVGDVNVDDIVAELDEIT